VFKIQNNIILKNLLDSDENLIFSTQPYYKEHKFIDTKKYCIILAFIIPLLLSIILSVCLYFWGQLYHGILSEFSGLHVALILVLGTSIGYFLLIEILSYIRKQRVSLKNTQYVITDQRVISIAPDFNNAYLVIPLAYEKISEFFIDRQKNKPFFHLYFKTSVMSSEEMNNSFIIARHVKKQDGGVLLENQTIFKLPEKQFILIWRKVKVTDNLTDILLQYLQKKQKNVPLTHLGIEKIEAHIGG